MAKTPTNRATINVAEYLRQQSTTDAASGPASAASCADCAYPKRPGEVYCPPCPHQPAYEVPAYEGTIKTERLPRNEPEPIQAPNRSKSEPEYIEMPPVTTDAVSAASQVAVQPVGSETAKTAQAGYESSILKPTEVISPKPPAPRLTYNPYTQPAPEPKPPAFRLTALPRQNEPPTEPVDFDGPSHALRRDPLDPDNLTISGHEHARLTRTASGQWIIENHSSLQTTYIRVDGPTVLTSGNVILLGDRMFRFETD